MMNLVCSWIVLSALLVVGCSSSSKKPATSSEMSQEFKLKKDRTDLETLRKDIPEEVKSQNDESAYLLSLFQDQNRNPQDISSRFNNDIRRKRDEYSKWERQAREDYNSKERRRREDYMAESKKKREDPSVKKMDREERNRFFQDSETERRTFFSAESDARRNFDSELRQKRSDFEANLKDLRLRFDHEYKTYSQAYNEKRKQQKSGTMSVQPMSPKSNVPAGFSEQDMKDIESIPKGNKSNLGD